MSRTDAAGVFAPRPDADWEMFCRGQGGDADVAPTQAPVELAPPKDDAGPESSAASVRHFFTKIVGLPYPNADGTSRREAVRVLRRWELVHLVHRPDNPVDPNAVAVLRAGDARQLGYLPAATAHDVVAAARERGSRFLAIVSEVTGAGPDDLLSVAAAGAQLLVLILENGATRATVRQYLLGLMKVA